MPAPGFSETLRFGDFELEGASYELRRAGRVVRLERQPMDLLIFLLERRGQLVSRADIVDRLWGRDVFVDVDTSIHTAVRKIRQALRDSADAPLFVETVPGRGYRFIGAVDAVPPASALPTAASALSPQTLPTRESRSSRAPAPKAGRTAAALGLILLILLAAVLGWAWRSREAPPGRVTLAVLPFGNLSGDGEQDYVADGLTEETIAMLGRVSPEQLRVVARTSTLAYRRATKSAAVIGRELGVDYLVEGSVRSESGRLRVTAALIRVADQVQVWSESYDRESTSLLGLQQELSLAIADHIRLQLSPDRLDTVARRQTGNADAYDLYLRGRNFEHQRTPATNRRAIEYYADATRLDASYALAWSGISRVLAASTINGDAPPLEVSPRARQAAARAVEADPDLAEAQFALGYVNWLLDWNWRAAEAGLRRTIALDPSHVMGHLILGHALSQMGRQDEARPLMRRARELEPLNPLTHALSSQVAIQAREYQEALEHAQRAVAVDSEFWIGHMMRGQAYGHLEQSDRAVEALTLAARFSGQNSKAISQRGYFLARAGRTAEASDVLASLEAASRTTYVPPYAMGLIHAGLEEWDPAFTWLERAHATGDVHLMYLTADAKWDPLRADPRFEALLARCGFVQASTAAPDASTVTPTTTQSR